MNDIEFSRKLIKGKIAEIIFSQMIRDENRYEVIPFGYENTVPTLAQYQRLVGVKQVIENISDAPDFALVSPDKSKVYLVEVKYQSSRNPEYLKKEAEDLLKRWKVSWIFLATPQGFYCDLSRKIAESGEIKELPESWVALDKQKDYLKLLNEFEPNNQNQP